MSTSQRHLAFVSYSHTEAKWYQRITVMLAPYERDGHLRVWADPYVPVGASWRREIDRALAQTRVAVLLVSARFETSPFIYETELPALLAASEAGQVVVVAVPVGASSASGGSGAGLLKRLTELQWARSPSAPLDLLPAARRSAELARIAKRIAEACGPPHSPERIAVAAHGGRRLPVLMPDRLAALHDVPPVPTDLVERTALYDRIKEEMLSQRAVGLTGRIASVGVQGLAGVGKTVLAQLLARDDDIRRSFPDGIYWVTVGQRSDLWSLQVSLLHRLDPTAAPATLVEARALLKQQLESRCVLLVLDDVWDVGQALAFDLLSAQSCVLMTTREAAVIRALGAAEYALDVFNRDESLAFLSQRSGAAVLPPEAELIARACDDLPMALAIVAGAVRDGRSWGDVHRQLEDARGTYADHPFRRVFQALEASVDWLSREDAARYLELAVFPDDERVSESVVQRYWRHTGGLDVSGCSALLERLHDKNLLSLSGTRGTREVSFHDLQLQFLRLQTEDPEALHRALLAANRPPSDGVETGAAWSELPDSELYLWRYVPHHMQHAGAAPELRALLLDPAWIEAKLRAVGMEGLLATYVPFGPDPVVSMVADTLRLASHALIPNPGEVRSQLCGRLSLQQSEEIQNVLATRFASHGSLWLRPVATALTAPGGALRSILTGHSSYIAEVAITPDGTRAVSASADGTLRVWDLLSGRAQQVLAGHTDRVEAVALTPDGTRAVSAGRDNTVRVWDLASGHALHVLKGHSEGAVGIAVTPDGARAVSTENYGAVQMWDLVSGSALCRFDKCKGGTGASFVAVTADGTRAVQGSNATIRVWDGVSRRLLHTFAEFPDDVVSALAATSDGTRAVYGTTAGGLRVLDLASGRLLLTLEGHTREIKALALTQDGLRLVSGSDDCTLRVWDLENGRLLHTLDGHTGWVRAVALTPDDMRAVSASDDATLRVWDLESGRPLHMLTGHTERIWTVALSPDGSLALSGALDDTLRVWELARGGQAPAEAARHAGPVRSVITTPDGMRAISVAEDATVLVWELASGRILHSFEGVESRPPHTRYGNRRVTALTMTPDGTRAVWATWAGMRVWDIASGEVLCTLREHFGLVTAVALARDGTLAVSASEDETLRVWDLVNGHSLMTFEDEAAIVAVTPDGTRAVSAGYGRVLRVWDLTRGRALLKGEAHTASVIAVVVTPDGSRAVSAAEEAPLFVWDLWSRHPMHKLEGHQGSVTAVAVTPDGTRAVSASYDKTVRTWDLASGRALHVLRGHTNKVNAVAVSPDGTWVVSAADDATVRVWDLASDSCLASFTADTPMTSCAAAGPLGVVAGAADGRVHVLRLER